MTVPNEEPAHEVNYMGNQLRHNFNAGGFSVFLHGQQYNQQQGQWRNHLGNPFNKDQGGPSTRPQQQGPSLYDRTTKLEETLAQFMQNSTESAIKNLEVQVGQLAKQLADGPSSSFSANTEKNPKEECKVVVTRSRMATHVDEGKTEKKVEEHKQQLATEPTLELVSDLVELEEVMEDEDDQQERETPIKESEIEIKMKEDKEKEKEKEKEEMAFRKRKAPTSVYQARYDRSRFTSQEAWDCYSDIVISRKILPERNVMIYHTKFDEFKAKLKRRNWHKELTNFMDRSTDVAIIKEFYANLYDPKDNSPKQVRVRGHLIKFDADALNTFLKTPMIIEEGEELSSYSRFCHLRPDPSELPAQLCIPGRGFELNADGLPLKILRKNLTTLAQTWSILSFSNLALTSHTSNITLDRARLIYDIIQKMDMNLGYIISSQISMIAQHDSSRLGFPALITALCKARGSLSLAINLAYVKKNCWNLDDPSVSFRGPHKARGKRSETLPSFEIPPLAAPSTTVPTSSAPSASAPLPAPIIAPSIGSSSFTLEILFAMLQSLHRGHIIIM
ncbi:hypothetical protein GmHk_20G056863 [Glycine max]|nr:hypothetical protein GmHk_20G056863 [Glycine max]